MVPKEEKKQDWKAFLFQRLRPFDIKSRMSNIESNKSQNGGLEDYNNISDGIFPHFTTTSIKLSLG
jgi:hypothetical protein